MKKTAAVLFFLIICVCLNAQQNERTFTWDVKFYSFQSQKFLPVLEIIEMETGNQFLFTIASDANTYCYIAASMSSGTVSILFNRQLTENLELIFGPFGLTEPAGTEKIYIVMSNERLTNLDNLIRVFNSDSRSAAHAENIISEIQRLENEVLLSGDIESEFIPVNTNGTRQNATRFSGGSLYVTTIAVSHSTLLILL